MKEKKPSVMFVCLGNICRSPAAEAILQKMEPEWFVASSGIGSWHIGHLPDSRMRQAALSRGFPLTKKAQQFLLDHFQEFDLILAADHEVLHHLQSHAKTPGEKAKVHLITAFSELYRNQEIPDPFYRGDEAFHEVLDMLEEACQGISKQLRKSSCQ